MRPATSLGPPAANGTTRVSGRLGQFCAGAVAVVASSASIAPKTFTRGLIARLLMHMFVPGCMATWRAGARRTHYRLSALGLPSRSCRSLDTLELRILL